MKYRNGFISNSSSSSFVILKKDITAYQLWQILHVVEEVKKLPGITYPEDAEGWAIREDDTSVSGYTTMDNFDISAYFEAIGISSEAIIWEEY